MMTMTVDDRLVVTVDDELRGSIGVNAILDRRVFRVVHIWRVTVTA
jgi:hypothetical protein